MKVAPLTTVSVITESDMMTARETDVSRHGPDTTFHSTSVLLAVPKPSVPLIRLPPPNPTHGQRYYQRNY